MNKRDFLKAGIGFGVAGAVLAQTPAGRGQNAPIPKAKAKTTRLFKSPGLYPNGLAAAPEGLWIAQQKTADQIEQAGGNKDEECWLVDWNGKLLKTVTTHSRNTSGLAYGDGYIWMGANAAPFGIHQVDMNSKEISHRPIPLDIAPDAGGGGGCHGLQWRQGKLWIAALRLGGLLRVDPKTWTPEVLIPARSEEKPRLHDITFDDEGNIWFVSGNNSTGMADTKPGLVKLDGKTGRPLLTVDFAPDSCDPHGLEFHNGKLISCDAGVHPNWKVMESPNAGYIFQIDILA